MEHLESRLREMDGLGYKAYKSLRGVYQSPGFVLCADRIQGDPFASPSRFRLRIPMSEVQIPAGYIRERTRLVAVEDFLSRRFEEQISGASLPSRGTGKSGLVRIDSGGQEILSRTAVRVTPDWVEARLRVGLPARGRRIAGKDAIQLLCRDLPGIAESSIRLDPREWNRMETWFHCAENQEQIRSTLASRSLVGFVANGAILPRASGVSDQPMSGEEAVASVSPESLEVSFELPHTWDGSRREPFRVSGMGIPEGVTLIVGGGYHGKSTLLRALERGVYPHIPGDGREGVVTRADAVKIRAEDGRRVEGVDISGFIGRLPGGRGTTEFRSEDASASTSQAANIMEALEAGSRLLLLDEDTCATNFMVRDARMQALVSREDEPITTFLDRVRQLHEQHGVSTILVMGGCGDYFSKADTVILMREYVPEDATGEAHRIAQRLPSARRDEGGQGWGFSSTRRPLAGSFDPSRGRRSVKIDARDRNEIRFGRTDIDLRAVEQLVDTSQTRALGYSLHWLASGPLADGCTLEDALNHWEAWMEEDGLEELEPGHQTGTHPGELALPRRYELAAAVNRLRTMRVKD